MPISQLSIDFLFNNFLQNSREWFKENRDTYKALVEKPMLDLAEEILPTILKIDPLITSEPKRCLSRIWLDMRINRSGMYFRDHMWLVFRRGKGMQHPSYYFEFSPQGYRYGVGYYSTPSTVMETLRQWVLNGDKRYIAAQESLDSLPSFHLQGDEYKRKKYPDAPPKKQEWLNRKALYISRDETDPKLLFSDQLGTVLIHDFLALAPVYQLFLEAHMTTEI